MGMQLVNGAVREILPQVSMLLSKHPLPARYMLRPSWRCRAALTILSTDVIVKVHSPTRRLSTEKWGYDQCNWAPQKDEKGRFPQAQGIKKPLQGDFKINLEGWEDSDGQRRHTRWDELYEGPEKEVFSGRKEEELEKLWVDLYGDIWELILKLMGVKGNDFE